MRRRLSAIVLYATLLAWLTGVITEAGAADPPRKIARVAYVAGDYASSSARSFSAFRDRLRELGWIEGQNLVIDQHWGEGNSARFPDLMSKALAGNPDVLVTLSTLGAIAAQKATRTVPIVVASMGDPVRMGVVTNLARPGGNLTALSVGYTDGFAGKWLELLLEAVPKAKKLP